MADFKFPDAWLPDRESGTNDVGSTLLGGASSLSPRWDYLRTKPQPQEGSYAGAPNVEPPPGSLEYREAQAALAALQAVLPQTKSAAAATALAAAGEGAWSSGRLAPIAARLTPLAAAAAPAAVLAAPLIALPKIAPQDETIPLGNDLRARRPIGQRSIIFERRVDGGLLGTGAGAKWEELPPVDTTFGDGMPGRRPVLVDADQFRSSVGTEAADRLLAKGGVIDQRSAANKDKAVNRAGTAPGSGNELPLPPVSLASKVEVRIGVSLNGSAETEKRQVSREDIMRVCPNFGDYEQISMQIGQKYKAAGMVNGLEYGQSVHGSLKASLMMHGIQSSLHERGIFQLKPEIALLEGRDKSYSKGSRRLDVLELHNDHVTVCVYELKTGGARIRDQTIDDYLREASLYAKANGFGYPNVYFIPIRVP